MTTLQWIVNLIVFPFVLVAVGVFLTVNLIVDVWRYRRCCSDCDAIERGEM